MTDEDAREAYTDLLAFIASRLDRCEMLFGFNSPDCEACIKALGRGEFDWKPNWLIQREQEGIVTKLSTPHASTSYDEQPPTRNE